MLKPPVKRLVAIKLTFFFFFFLPCSRRGLSLSHHSPLSVRECVCGEGGTGLRDWQVERWMWSVSEALMICNKQTRQVVSGNRAAIITAGLMCVCNRRWYWLQTRTKDDIWLKVSLFIQTEFSDERMSQVMDYRGVRGHGGRGARRKFCINPRALIWIPQLSVCASHEWSSTSAHTLHEEQDLPTMSH